VKDEDLARLMPSAGTVVEEKEEKVAPSEAKPTATPFDKSPATVFRIKSSSNSEYTVQVASYPEEAAAVQVVDDWKKKGYMAFLSVEDLPDKGKWFRVNVGNFGDEPSAQSFAKTIEENEHITPQVVVNE
jgi:cell division septation protein DedD